MKIGLYDADLMDGGTRHPNLTLMKLSEYFNERGVDNELMFGGGDLFDAIYDKIYVSKVFQKTKLPIFNNSNIVIGGTGLYTDNPNINEEEFKMRRQIDMHQLEEVLPQYHPSEQMPNYHLYDGFIAHQSNKKAYKDYTDFSIGFLTRGCVRHCPFCVNRYEDRVTRYSHLSSFLDDKRKYIYLWDDNVMASAPTLFHECLEELIDSGKSFQFKQGLDLRLMTDEKAKILTSCRYYGDYIFAFDNWSDREWIEKNLQLWRRYTNKSTKLYLFCGFKRNMSLNEFFDDILYLFKRIAILMRYGCLGYVMRHANYTTAPLANMYVQIARWVNQPAFYKKMSFREFIMTEKSKKPLQTFSTFCTLYKDRLNNISYLFDMKFEHQLVNF